MPYISIEFNDEINIFDLRSVSIRKMPLDKGNWEICPKGFRTFCERVLVYVLTDPDRRFNIPITGIRIFETPSDLVSFLNGETASEFCRLKSSVKESEWPEPSAEIKAKSAIKKPTLLS